MFILAPLVIGGTACFIGIIGLITFVANFVSGYRCVFRRCGSIQCVHVIMVLYAILVIVAGGYEYLLYEFGNKLDRFFGELACSEAISDKVTTWHWYQKWLIRTMGLLAFILLILIVTGSCLDDQLSSSNDGEYEPTKTYDPYKPLGKKSITRKSESILLYSDGANQPAESVR